MGIFRALFRKADAFTRRFTFACEGIAAIEFAYIAPVMIALYFGTTELSDGLIASS